jgi:hypothetical protein
MGPFQLCCGSGLVSILVVPRFAFVALVAALVLGLFVFHLIYLLLWSRRCNLSDCAGLVISAVILEVYTCMRYRGGSRWSHPQLQWML